MATIGDLYFTFRGDDQQLQKDAGTSGDKAGSTIGGRMGAAITKTGLASKALRAVGGLMAGALGAAAKGALALEDVQVRYQAATGATAEASKHAASVINQAAADNLQSLSSIADAAVKVHNDLGLTGAAADAATVKFAQYARVTGQDAAGAVTAFDHALDAWNLTGDKAAPLMDLLIASQHKYGGSLEESQAALAGMAPALQAMGVSITGGVALLNMFEAGGLDAGKATAALGKAVKQLKPGQTLDDLIKQITSIQDPTKRAQKAIEIFGAKGGVGLANVLRPGVTGLEDFAVSATDAKDATQKASDTLDQSFSEQVRKKIAQVGAGIRQFGADFGPALTGAGALASLVGSVFPGIGKSIASGLKGALGPGIAKVVGPQLAKALGLSVAKGVTDGAASGVATAAASSAVSGSTGKLGSFLGSKLGKGLSVAFAAIAIVEVFQTYNDIKAGLDAQSKQIGTDLGNEITAGSTASLQQSKAALETGIKQLSDLWYNPFAGGQKDALQQQLDATNAELQKRASEAPTELSARLAAGKAQVDQAAGDLTSGLPDALTTATGEAVKVAAKLPGDIADAIKTRRDAAAQAMADLRDAMLHPMSITSERARLIGYLTSKALAQGLRSADPEVKARAQAARDTWEAQIKGMPTGASGIGKKAGEALAAALKSKDPRVRAEAARLKATFEAQVNAAKGRPAGEKAGAAMAAGVASQTGKMAKAAAALAKEATDAVLAWVLADIKAHPAKYGDTMGGSSSGHHAKGGRMRAGEPGIVGEEGWEVFVPDVSGTIVPHTQAVAMAAAPGGGGSTTVNVYNPKPEPAGTSVRRELRKLAVTGVTR